MGVRTNRGHVRWSTQTDESTGGLILVLSRCFLGPGLELNPNVQYAVPLRGRLAMGAKRANHGSAKQAVVLPGWWCDGQTFACRKRLAPSQAETDYQIFRSPYLGWSLVMQ